jgi:calcineurin-like phosphoesterase family protein
MSIFFTSDHHFAHGNIIKYSKRPFSSSEEMDNVMIERWNEKISKKDTVYYLGDITLTSDVEYISKLFSRLNGNVLFIEGNHDYWIKETNLIPRTKSGLIEFLPPLVSIKVNHPALVNKKGHLPIVLCHYSIRNWEMAHYGAWHLWAHSHGRLGKYGKSFDIGVDTNNFYPYSLEEVGIIMETLSMNFDASAKEVWN